MGINNFFFSRNDLFQIYFFKGLFRLNANMSSIRFESSWKKDKERDAIRSAREAVLASAEAKGLREAERRKKEDSWMLPNLDKSLDASNNEKKSRKRKKKDKKSKKHKKEKEKSDQQRAPTPAGNSWIERAYHRIKEQTERE